MRINKLAGGAGIPDVSVDYITYTIIIKIPKQLASMGVVEDLLELIIPIGMGYRIIEYEVVSGQANDNFWFSDKIDVRQNVRILPTYKMGIGGPKIEYIDGKPHYVDDSSMPSLHIAPGVVGEIETDVSIWPDGENQTQGGNKSQGAEVEYNLVTTMGEIRDSHGSKWQIGDDVIQDQTVDDHTQDGVTWKEIEKTKPKKKKK